METNGQNTLTRREKEESGIPSTLITRTSQMKMNPTGTGNNRKVMSLPATGQNSGIEEKEMGKPRPSSLPISTENNERKRQSIFSKLFKSKELLKNELLEKIKEPEKFLDLEDKDIKLLGLEKFKSIIGELKKFKEIHEELNKRQKEKSDYKLGFSKDEFSRIQDVLESITNSLNKCETGRLGKEKAISKFLPYLPKFFPSFILAEGGEKVLKAFAVFNKLIAKKQVEYFYSIRKIKTEKLENMFSFISACKIMLDISCDINFQMSKKITKEQKKYINHLLSDEIFEYCKSPKEAFNIFGTLNIIENKGRINSEALKRYLESLTDKDITDLVLSSIGTIMGESLAKDFRGYLEDKKTGKEAKEVSLKEFDFIKFTKLFSSIAELDKTRVMESGTIFSTAFYEGFKIAKGLLDRYYKELSDEQKQMQKGIKTVFDSSCVYIENQFNLLYDFHNTIKGKEYFKNPEEYEKFIGRLKEIEKEMLNSNNSDKGENLSSIRSKSEGIKNQEGSFEILDNVTSLNSTKSTVLNNNTTQSESAIMNNITGEDIKGSPRSRSNTFYYDKKRKDAFITNKNGKIEVSVNNKKKARATIYVDPELLKPENKTKIGKEAGKSLNLAQQQDTVRDLLGLLKNKKIGLHEAMKKGFIAKEAIKVRAADETQNAKIFRDKIKKCLQRKAGQSM